MVEAKLTWELKRDLNKNLYEQMMIEFKPMIELGKMAFK